jgi:hypothetical protein
MTVWDSIVQEISQVGRPDALDLVRRAKIARVRQLTGRDLLIYATDFSPLNPMKAQIVSGLTPITFKDKDGIDEIMRNVAGPEVDILLHSGGGSAEATESIVAMLRAKYTHVRFIVPSMAKSAATILAMSGNEILMDNRSELGPTDPQMVMSRDGRVIVAPAQAIKDQYATAQAEINADPRKLPAWVPILRDYGPSLLAECDNHLRLAAQLVSTWLAMYMFQGDPDGAAKAAAVASFLAGHNNFHSHSRRVGIADLAPYSLNIRDLGLQDAATVALAAGINELYTAIMITFAITGAYRIFENSAGDALIQQVQLQATPTMALPQQIQPVPTQPISPPPVPQPAGSPPPAPQPTGSPQPAGPAAPAAAP